MVLREPPSLQFCSSLENQQPAFVILTNKLSVWQLIEGAEPGDRPLKSMSSVNFHCLKCVVSPWVSSRICATVLAPSKMPLPKSACQGAIVQVSGFLGSCVVVELSNRQNKQTKKVEQESLGNEVYLGALKILDTTSTFQLPFLPCCFLSRNWQACFKSYVEIDETENIQNNQKKKKVDGLILTDFKNLFINYSR